MDGNGDLGGGTDQRQPEGAVASGGAPAVAHNPEKKRFECGPGDALAVLEYSVGADGLVHFNHTFVPEALRGKGLAAVLVRSALQDARRLGWRVVSHCAFVDRYLQRHPEFNDVVEKPAD